MSEIKSPGYMQTTKLIREQQADLRLWRLSVRRAGLELAQARTKIMWEYTKQLVLLGWLPVAIWVLYWRVL